MGFQFFPHLHHSKGVELAVAEQGFACSGGIFRGHFSNGREEAHGITAVLAEAAEGVVVQLWISREEGRQDALDAEGTAHGGNVVVAGAERVDEVLDVVCDVAQVIRQVREGIGQLPQAPAFEHLVVSKRADILRDIPAEGLSNVPARILSADAQEFLVKKGASLVLDDMQRILERNLLVGRCSRILRNRILLRLEVQEV